MHAATSAWPDDLLRIGDLTCESLPALLDLAARMKSAPVAWQQSLAGETVACFLDPPTTGMGSSVVAAAGRLGMAAVVLPSEELELGNGQPIGDIARSLSASVQAMCAYAVPHRTLRDVAAAASVPVINIRSDEHRPCQALADLLTLRERFGSLEGLAVAFVGDGSDGIAHSLMEAGAIAGMDIRIVSPPEYPPSFETRVGAEIFARFHGGRIALTDDAEEAVRGADAVYTAPWVQSGRTPDADQRRARLRHYQVHVGLMVRAKPTAVFMHCLPAHRGEEVGAHVLEGSRSVVWQQAANRLPAAQAVLYALVIASLERGHARADR